MPKKTLNVRVTTVDAVLEFTIEVSLGAVCTCIDTIAHGT